MIPIFDNGYSLWNKDFVDSRILSESMSFADSNNECIKLVNINKYIEHLPDMIGIFDEAFDLYKNKERKRDIKNGLKERIQDIEMYLENDINNWNQVNN